MVNPATPRALSRPGLVTFAGVLLLIYASFQAVTALSAFAHAAWLTSATNGWFTTNLWVWGILDAVIAVIAFYAAYDILQGGQVGRGIGLIIASISMIRWFFYLPYMTHGTIVGIVMLVLDVLVIYGLAAHGEFFRTNAP